VIEPKIILVPERGSVDIDTGTFAALCDNEAFWQLVTRKIISFTQPSPSVVRLQGSCYVGKVYFDGVVLEVREKVDGALAALLNFATNDAFRIERFQSPTTDFGSLITLLVKQYLDLLHIYVSLGRENHYEYKRFQGSLAGGRISILKTIGLRARGLMHQLVFDRATLNHATLQNRIFCAALIEVGRISRIASLSDTDLARARGLSIVFEDCRDAEVVSGSRLQFINAAQRLTSNAAQSTKDLLALASVLLSHQSFESNMPTIDIGPRAWFLNLETLFEVAVRQTLRKVVSPLAVRFREHEHKSTIFEKIEDQYKATPDLVVVDQLVVRAVGDVKYKEWGDYAQPSDIYQLLAHTTAFHSNLSFLIYPHDSFAIKDLGVSAMGPRTWLIAVDIRNLEANLRQAMTTVGVI
jgi:5-methylcytosine-specific restriction endonuclease McrBC regulatory subunit McrC